MSLAFPGAKGTDSLRKLIALGWNTKDWTRHSVRRCCHLVVNVQMTNFVSRGLVRCWIAMHWSRASGPGDDRLRQTELRTLSKQCHIKEEWIPVHGKWRSDGVQNLTHIWLMAFKTLIILMVIINLLHMINHVLPKARVLNCRSTNPS